MEPRSPTVIGYTLFIGFMLISFLVGNTQPIDNLMNGASMLFGIERQDDGTIQQGIDCNGPCG